MAKAVRADYRHRRRADGDAAGLVAGLRALALDRPIQRGFGYRHEAAGGQGNAAANDLVAVDQPGEVVAPALTSVC